MWTDARLSGPGAGLLRFGSQLWLCAPLGKLLPLWRWGRDDFSPVFPALLSGLKAPKQFTVHLCERLNDTRSPLLSPGALSKRVGEPWGCYLQSRPAEGGESWKEMFWKVSKPEGHMWVLLRSPLFG